MIMAPIATTSPFTWTPERQRRAHALTVRATFAKKAPAKPVACSTCHLLHPGEC
jgi:hypothetical protein